MLRLLIALMLLPFGYTFKGVALPVSRLRSLRVIEVGSVNEIPNGERKIVDTEVGAVIVANVGGSYYAVNAKCPHLGLPMKKGKIEVENGTPTITCNFHNSKFSLSDGKCTAWSTGALGLPGTGFIGDALGSIGGVKNSPATIYKVTVEGEKLILDL